MFLSTVFLSVQKWINKPAFRRLLFSFLAALAPAFERWFTWRHNFHFSPIRWSCLSQPQPAVVFAAVYQICRAVLITLGQRTVTAILLLIGCPVTLAHELNALLVCLADLAGNQRCCYGNVRLLNIIVFQSRTPPPANYLAFNPCAYLPPIALPGLSGPSPHRRPWCNIPSACFYLSSG